MAVSAEIEQAAPRAAAGPGWTGWPFLAFALMFLGSAWLMTASFSARHGGVLYPLDDSYIHLALARTLATTGVWGVDAQHPAAASSSPLWTVLLAGAFKAAPGASREAMSWVPLIGNFLAGLGLVAVWTRIAKGVAYGLLAVIILVFAVPVASIGMIGMEHVLHALLATLLAWFGARLINQGPAPSLRQLGGLAALSALATAARYESLALIAAIMLLALTQRRWSLLPALLLPAVAVVLGFGLIWVHAGGWWLPNSLLAKAPGIGGHSLGWRLTQFAESIASNALSSAGPLMAGFAVALFLLRAMLGKRRCVEGTLALLAALATTGQFLAGSFNWLHRYEAWLVALDGLALILVAQAVLGEQRKVFLKVMLVMALACSSRAFAATTETVLAAHDREWEHFGPTLALDGLGRQPVMINDIGAMAYYGRVEPIDVFGLANNDALRMRRKGDAFTPADVAGFARSQGAHVAELQVCWQDQYEHIPPGWRLVEAWIGPRNVVFGDRTVGFLADGEASAAALRQVLATAPAPPGVVRLKQGDPRVSAFNAAGGKAAGAAAVCPVMVASLYH